MEAFHGPTTSGPIHLIENSATFHPSRKTILNLLNTKCTNSLQNLKQAHALILKSGHLEDHYVSGTLIKCYANPEFGSLPLLLQLLDRVLEPNVFVWNTMIRGCLDLDDPSFAILMYHKMVVSGTRPNNYTYPQIFKACSVKRATKQGPQVHAHAVKNGFSLDRHVASAGIRMYVSLGCLGPARNFLKSAEQLDAVCLNAMIDGYMASGHVNSAEELFRAMKEKTVVSWNTMISGLCSNNMLPEARKYFDEMVERDEVSWSAIIDGHSKNGFFEEALEIFDRMGKEGIRLGKYALSSALTACADLAALDRGETIHAYIRENGITVDAVLGTSLVDMYAKCGCLDLAWDVFENIKRKKVFCWNAMIGGLGAHGRAEDALGLFSRMTREGVRPNGITFVGLINACAHAGLVREGLECFTLMREKYSIRPTVEHYGCVVNLLGKAGFYKEALRLMGSMPAAPSAAVWGALLAACATHRNVELGEKLGEILIGLEPENSGRYALLSNLYAGAGDWERVGRVRMLMKERGVKTAAGRSSIEVDGVREFGAGG